MKRGGLPPVRDEKKIIVRSACTSASVAKGSGILRPVVIERGVEERLHRVGHGERDAAHVGAPFELAHEAAADGVQVLEQVAGDQIERQALVEAARIHRVAQHQPFAQMPVHEPAQRLEFFGLVRLLVQHVGQQLHVQPGDLEAELLAGGDDVRHGRLHPHRVVAEDDDAAALERLRGDGRGRPIHQRVRRALGHQRVQAGVGPGADVEVRQLAVLHDRAVDRVGEDDARLRPAVAAGEVDRRVGRELRQQRDHAELRERPGVGRADQRLDARILELLGDRVGLRPRRPPVSAPTRPSRASRRAA